MADLGAINQASIGIAVRIQPIWTNKPWVLNFDTDLSGTLSGTLTVDSVPVANTKVYLRYRTTDALVGITTTAADGTFSFSNLEVGQAKYFAYAYIDGSYNVARFDKVAAV